MSLQGFEKIAARPRGGVTKVELAPANSPVFAGPFADGGLDPATGFFAEYVFREDRASYSESLSGDELYPLVRHTLTMELPAAPGAGDPAGAGSGSGLSSGSVGGGAAGAGAGATAGAAQTMLELLEHSSAHGLVARVTLASGEVVVCGLSPRFGTAYPMRVSKIERSSGRSPADFPTVEVTLECTY